MTMVLKVIDVLWKRSQTDNNVELQLNETLPNTYKASSEDVAIQYTQKCHCKVGTKCTCTVY